jgi:hypothetical protein
MFESLDAFRAHFAEPTMPIEQCPICSKLPVRMSREVEDQDVSDDRPMPESLQLERILEGNNDEGFEEVFRCSTCRRLYLGQTTFGVGYFDYYATWTRYDVNELFKTTWAVAKRLPDRSVFVVIHDFFPNHALVKFRDTEGWHALDATNRLTSLDKSTLLKIIESDPPRVTGDLELAKRYASFVNHIDVPDEKEHDSIDSIPWMVPLTPDEKSKVNDVSARHRIEPITAEPRGEDVVVRFFVTSRKHLFRRDITLLPDGHYRREGKLLGWNLPIVVETLEMFRSLDAFRAHCGDPTIPLEACPICSKLPEHWNSDADPEPPEMQQLVDFIETTYKRCPTCHRLYESDSHSYGNDIYRGNETSQT